MIQKILANLKIEALNEMQQAVLEAAETKKEQDMVLLSPYRLGQNLAFLLPVLQLLKPEVNGCAGADTGAEPRAGYANRECV
jgi:ATP-independent RNA helicase DbpA